MNLTTAVDNLQFNATGEMLCMSSSREADALRMVHLPSATVFQNWPTSKTPLGHVWGTDFSGKGGYVAVGNDKGKCLLYRLNHYKEV
jgi:U3 small nucleolar RNA-associated protein 18